jgi:protoporphyrinogen oxidase
LAETARHVDNLIVGAGLVGSMTGWILAQQGYPALMLEASDTPGGVNGSFRDALGNLFDHGRHVINADRSPFTSHFFTAVLGGAVRRFNLETGIFVHGHLIPYAAPLEQWPEPLRARIRLDERAPPVRVGSDRAAFARAYGGWFADLVFEEMLEAFPTLRWKRSRGCPEALLMDWIFPWFFPVSRVEAAPDPETEAGVYSAESRDYHYRARHARPPRTEVLYPDREGFGRWIDAMLEQCRRSVEVMLGVRDLRFDFEPGSARLRAVAANGCRYTAERVFWCAPLPVLCRQLDWTLPRGQPQSELLGSFAFARPVATPYHDILFADPAHLVRRVNFPERLFGGSGSRTLQVEFTCPDDEYGFDAPEWRERWLASLIATGVVAPDNAVLNFDFKRLSRGILTLEDLDGFVTGCRRRLDESDTNLVAPRLSAASDNNSRLVPEVFRRVYDALLDA